MYIGSTKEGGQAVHVGRADEAVQGRRGAEGEWSRQAVRARREGTNGTGEWPIRGRREACTWPKRSASTISDDEAPARCYLRDPLSPTTKMGL